MLNAALLACSSKVRATWPLAASYNLIVFSRLDEATHTPSPEKAKEITLSQCPLRVSRSVI